MYACIVRKAVEAFSFRNTRPFLKIFVSPPFFPTHPFFEEILYSHPLIQSTIFIQDIIHTSGWPLRRKGCKSCKNG